jgi:hypothetical protein
MQAYHRTPHCHPLDVHEYSCVVNPRRQSSYASFIRRRRWPLMVRPQVSPAGLYRNIEDKHASSTSLGTGSIRSFDAPVPPSQRRPLYFHGYLIHIGLYIVDGRYASCPYSMGLLVSLQATTVYRRAVAHTTTYAFTYFVGGEFSRA